MSGFSFGGTPASSGASSGSLFGSAGGAAPTSNLFGSSTGDVPSLFGGQKPAEASSENKSIFGGTAPQSTGFSFGGGASSNANSSATPSTGSAPLFGSAGNASTNQATGSTPIFGSNANASTGAPSFSFTQPSTAGNNNNNNKPATPTSQSLGGTSLFGANASKDAAPTGGLFGSNQQTTPAGTKSSAISFSTTPAGPPPSKPNPPLFGGPTTGFQKTTAESGPSTATPTPIGGAAPSGGLFGAKPAETSSSAQGAPKSGFQMGGDNAATGGSGSLFSPQASGAPTPSFSLGGAAGASKPSFSLGGASTGEAPKPAFSLGGIPTASTGDTPKPTFSLGGTSNTASPGGAAQSGGLFGAKKDDPAKPASSGTPLFSGLGQNKDTAATSAPATSSTSAPSLFGAPAASSATSAAPTTTATSAPSGGLFGAANPATSSAAPAASTNANSAPAAGGLFGSSKPAGGLGPSTTGPAPPPTSRLASKSLDEILTVWTTSLSNHQKSFGNLATKISTWDRLLVENSDKISKLYSRTFKAEKDISEVERQLASVEGQQAELESWLDHYERLVDEMVTKSGGMESGVDAERERTYRTAERATNRLTEISHDLTSMIDEINLASSSLNQTSNASANNAAGGSADPLAQIVRVLNSHLIQLQTIDQGAALLQQKVVLAQKEARTMGGRAGLGGLGFGGGDEGGVEGFLRSMNGRR